MSLSVPDLGPDSPFLPDTKLQYAWDSVSLTAALACWRRYYYTIIEGLQPKGPASAIALDFGIAFHRGLELYHQYQAAGSDHEGAMSTMIQVLTWNDHYARLPTQDDVAEQADAHDEEEDDGIHLRNSKVRTRYHLIRSLVWYLENYRNDPLKTLILPSGEAAVEVSFRLPLPLEISGHQALLVGHLDRAAFLNEDLYVVDYKTTKSLSRQFFADFTLSHQFTGYTIAGRAVFHQPIAGAFVDGIALQMGGAKFQRAPTHRTEGQVIEYLETVEHVLAEAEAHHDDAMVRSDTPERAYPMNTAACYFCHFKELCSKPPEHRERYKALLFDRAPAWNPLENR